jgi:tau tubulin kinase
LWSVFYVIVEFALGSLPWRKIKDKEHIGELKERFTNAELVKDLPPEYQLFMEHLQKLGYADEPDYDYLRRILMDIYTREGYSPDEPYDWNIKEKTSLPISRGNIF